ncbi:hypothetical protein B0T22DRAFT_203652 [Podospora appendiculata]|uniref:DNA polymerase n=1 Tax=Podospora appendiculata TaxID=314037 RepID=A0AAE1C9Y0_9PEZI|nr:hypothetical protein B0T22DRAFT_203652 [Podospora appendiculata]
MALDFPVIFLLAANLGSDELLALEEQIPTLTYDINEAQLVLGRISRKERALFELRKLKLATEEVSNTKFDHPRPGGVLDSSTVKVVKLSWFTESIKAGEVLPLDNYVIYEGHKISSTPTPTPKSTPKKPPPPAPSTVLKRPLSDAEEPAVSSRPRSSHGHGGKASENGHRYFKRPALLKQTTSEHDIDLHLPPIPDYLHTTYSCQRPTPVHPPNDRFIDELAKIRTARTLVGDQIGVRAYSSAIATLAAYPYTLSSAQEVTRLPGCGAKIALLFQEFKDTGKLKEADDDEADPRLAVLKQFYDIWGVAETTAREFYNKGWRDLDDVIEYGWEGLTRVQQIGVKYYDEFKLKMPRSEVEAISNVILEHAQEIHPGFQMVIVGGYRRGKTESGDVDVVLSHPDEAATKGFVERLVIGLERDKFITHTLIFSTANSERGQTPVKWKGDEKRGSGFDTLDKALVVWQDPKWTTGEKKNPNPHRRVDIIISPWKTAGCAVLGWTSGTTFQRDLRRYCKKERSLKFDSSGIRSRKDGSWADFERGPDGQPAPDMLTAERRVFAGLGLEWRAPGDRCTR